ncbi:hypothetical protein KAS50_02400 [bacterium]|nr:hypothetical protein [bacterium]
MKKIKTLLFAFLLFALIVPVSGGEKDTGLAPPRHRIDLITRQLEWLKIKNMFYHKKQK